MTSTLSLLIRKAPRIRTFRHVQKKISLRLQYEYSCRRISERCGTPHTYIRTFSSTAQTTLERQQQKEPDDASSSSITLPIKETQKDIFSKVASIAKPEFPLIIASSLTLGITSSITLLLPYCSGKVIDLSLLTTSSGAASGAFTPWEAAAGLFGLTVVAGGGVFARSMMLTMAGNRIVARLRKRLFRAALAQEIAFFEQSGDDGTSAVYDGDDDNDGVGPTKIDTTNGITKTADLLSRLSNDAQMIQTAVTTHAVGALRGTVMSIGATTMLVQTSPMLALVSLSTLPPIFLTARTFGKSMREWQGRVQEMQGDATSVAQEVLSGIKTVRQFAAEPYEADRYAEKVNLAHREAIKIGKSQAMFDGSVHIAANAAVLGVVGYGGTMVLSGDITAGDLASFLMYSMMVAGNVSSLSSTYADMMKAIGASERVFSIIDRIPQMPSTLKVISDIRRSDTDSSNFLESELEPLPIGEKVGEKVKPAEPLSIEFSNIKFAYPSRPEYPILGPQFSLKISKGEHLALVGGSGSGKSTVAALLTRLYDIADGDSSQESGIFIDRKDLRGIDPTWLRTRVGVVSQEPQLFAA